MNIKDNAYFSKKIKFKRLLLRRFFKGKLVPGLYVIRMASDPDQLEIIKSEFYVQKEIMSEDKMIVGFTKSYDEALDFVIDVTGRSLEEFGEPLIKEYLNK